MKTKIGVGPGIACRIPPKKARVEIPARPHAKPQNDNNKRSRQEDCFDGLADRRNPLSPERPPTLPVAFGRKKKRVLSDSFLLQTAIETGSVEEVQNQLRRLGKSSIIKRLLNQRNEALETSLHIAIAKSNAKVIQLLVEHGADVAVLNQRGESPLLLATTMGSSEAVAVLLKGVEARNDKRAVLMQAYAQAAKAGLMRRLVEYGMPIDADLLKCSILANDPELLQTFLNQLEKQKGEKREGKQDDFANGYWNDALGFAVEQSCPDVVRVLTKVGADVNAENKNGATPLLLAVVRDDTQMAKVLLDLGATVDQGCGGKTPLSHAMERGCGPMVELLLDHGIDLLQCDEDRQSLLHYAAHHPFEASVKALLAAFGKAGEKKVREALPTVLAVLKNSANDCPVGVVQLAFFRVKLALYFSKENYSSLIQDLSRHFPALRQLPSEALETGHADTRKLEERLVAHEPNILEGARRAMRRWACERKTVSGKTAFAVAVEFGHREVAECLIESGSDVDSRDNSGNWPLRHACLRRVDMISFLVDHGASVKQKWPQDMPPLELALRCLKGTKWNENVVDGVVALLLAGAETENIPADIQPTLQEAQQHVDWRMGVRQVLQDTWAGLGEDVLNLINEMVGPIRLSRWICHDTSGGKMRAGAGT